MGSEIATSPYSINCANRQCWLHSVRRRRIHCFLCMRPLSTRQPIVQGFCWAHGSPTSKSTSAPPATSQSFSITAETRLLAAHGMQCPLDALGIARDDGEVGFSRLVGLRAALFPIAQSSKRDFEACGKFLLGQREGAAKRFDTRNAGRANKQRLSVASSAQTSLQRRRTERGL